MSNSTFVGNDEVHVTNSFIKLNGVDGLYIDSISDVTISCNNIEFNTGNGISYTATVDSGNYPGGNALIVNNHILTNDGKGIEITNGCSRMFINNNQIRNNGTYGLRCVGGKEHFIFGNSFHVNGRLINCDALIFGYTSQISVSENLICCTDFNQTQTNGIELSYVTNAMLMANIVYNNSGQSLLADTNSSYVAKNNTGISDS
jgi:hypothetical protein